MDGNRDLCEERTTGRMASAVTRERKGRGGWHKQHKKDKGEGEGSGLPFERQRTLHPLTNVDCYRC